MTPVLAAGDASRAARRDFLTPVAERRINGQFGLVLMFVGMLSAFALALAAEPVGATSDGLVLGPDLTDTVSIEDFASYTLGAFPETWKVRGRTGRAASVYRVAGDNGAARFLAARADGSSVMIGLDREFDPARYPYLRWRWRVHEFPSGGNEKVQATNDSAAGIYVIFPGSWSFLPRVLKYVWSTSAPVGLRHTSPAYGNTKILVIASGPTEEPGQWRTETVNVRQDYEALFGSEPPVARGIGLLTDANDTGSVAAADYTDFQLLSSPVHSSDGPDKGTDEPQARPAVD